MRVGSAELLREYSVVLDEQVIGALKLNQSLDYDVEPGKHQLYLKIDWCRSNIVYFQSDGETIEFECGSNVQGWRVLLTIFYITLWKDQYLWLRRIKN
jgi:hypothetical protein